MSRLLQRFRKAVFSTMPRSKKKKFLAKKLDDKIALGVMLWGLGAVAEADEKFLPEEESKIREILLMNSKIRKQDFPIVLTAVKQAGISKLNVYRFVNEMKNKLTLKAKISILENLFFVAYADGCLQRKEYKIIKNIARLLGIQDRDLSKIQQAVTRISTKNLTPRT
ncbi:MAG: hypothetical protein A2Z72_00445 [Omnitrophica bacterium RBG_13_46_9]|nr:MAG: hypothetical protein A2Z72_00445 [Omnitrophica bacterium RBG_13_46_9]